MTSPLAHSSSDTARLMMGALGFHVGWQEPVYIPAPAAGANWSFTGDGRYFTRVLAITNRFATSAVVANRFPSMQLTDTNGVVISSVSAGGSIPASTSVTPYLMVGGPAYANGNVGATFGFLPDLLIPPGWVWQSSAANLDVGDQFSNVVLLVQRFPNDAAVISAVG